MLTVTGLAAGDYELRAGGRLFGKASAAQLPRGLNMASMTADPREPWDAQSCIGKELVEARDKLWMSRVMRSRFIANHPQNDALAAGTKELDDAIFAQQRAVAEPYPYRFEIRKTAGGRAPER